jgi:Terminase Bacteriophage T7, Ribonuclease H-like domain
MFLGASGGFLGGYDDKTLKTLVSVAKKHRIELILCEPNYRGGMFTKRVSTVH